MFNFMTMDLHENRVVGNYSRDNITVDTCSVNDGSRTYETGISINNENGWIIVEGYETKSDAKKGHDKWVKSMIDNPTQKLKDCENSYISQFAGMFDTDDD